ncbi:cytochrome P450 [Xanthovirga aplysinae]|uniref:cytochrome P450 n=1 Tax=Xanthovirga aplysinae TaxID=2529853 RepID=UPI0012BC62A8|nr:cytochrome P450 [Xanthovirga aplysinae]MTI31672.1 cytochrome P450 [Xanthovirga aplysinae]
MTFIKLADISDIKSGKIKEVNLGNKKIILFEYKGLPKAYQGTCPHQGGPLVEGHFKNGKLLCPFHQWEFSCSDGTNKKHKVCLKSYPIVVREEGIFLDPKEIDKEGVQEEKESIQTIEDLPSPKGTFLLGNLPQYKATEKHLALESWVKECGPLFRISLMGKRFVVSADHDFNHQILKNRPEKFRRYFKISEIMEEMGILGVFNAEGESWKKHRKITSEALNMKNIRGFFPTIAEVTLRFYHKLKRLENQGVEVDIQQELIRYTVDITTTIAFGYPMNTLEKEGDVIQTHLEKIFPMINARITAPFPYWRMFRLIKDRELDHSLLEIRKSIMHFISVAKNRLSIFPELKENPTNFLEALLVQQEKEGSFSDDEIFGNVFTLLLAGEDTTSNSISWALFYLAQNPEIVKKVRQETMEVFPGEVLPEDFDKINQLKYTEAVAMEAIRLKPVTPQLFIQSLEDQQIKNLKVEKGTTFMLANRVAQIAEENFTKAQDFSPERWLGTGCPIHTVHKPEVIKAFGAGSRYCPGKNLAMHEMIMALSMICKNFDLELTVEPDQVREVFAFTMYPKNLGLKFKSVPLSEFQRS